jgi:acetolactate synthase-1/2/3 large subunit
MGLDAINHDDEHFCGFIGSYGNRYANFAVAKSDLLIVLGSRLDARQTGDNKSFFARGAMIIHVDIDPYELNHNISETLSICCDVHSFIDALTGEIGNRSFNNKEWLHTINLWKTKYPSYPGTNENDYVDPNEFLYTLSKKCLNDAIVCSDVGQNQMWVAQSFSLLGNKRLLNSGGHGAMGYSLPAGIGAYFASSGKQIISIMGDGGIQMNLQELQTICRERIPLKIFVLNNNSLGMIRSYQEKYFDNKCYGSVDGFAVPNLEKLSYAFDISYTKICTNQDFDKLANGLNSSESHLFEVVLSPRTQVVPEPAPRRSVEDQFPLLPRDEFDQILNFGRIASNKHLASLGERQKSIIHE